MSPEQVDEWGPLYGEEEDLRRALQMSMATHEHVQSPVQETETNQSGLSISGPQFVDYSRFNDSNDSDRADLRTDHEITLPPELRHLFATSNRTGTHV